MATNLLDELMANSRAIPNSYSIAAESRGKSNADRTVYEHIPTGKKFIVTGSRTTPEGVTIPQIKYMLPGATNRKTGIQQYTGAGTAEYAGNNEIVRGRGLTSTDVTAAANTKGKTAEEMTNAAEENINKAVDEGKAKAQEATEVSRKYTQDISNLLSQDGYTNTIQGFADVAQKAGDEYARAKARRQADLATAQAKQNSYAQARTLGLSPGAAAMAAGNNAAQVWHQAHQQAENQAKQDYNNSYSQGLTIAQTQQGMADNRALAGEGRADTQTANQLGLAANYQGQVDQANQRLQQQKQAALNAIQSFASMGGNIAELLTGSGLLGGK